MDENRENLWRQEFANLFREKHERDVVRLRDEFNQKVSELESKIVVLKSEILDQSSVENEKINNQLDDVDTAFRGNSKVGIFEQLRTAKRSRAFIYILILFLFGFKILSISFDDWWKSFLEEHGLKTKTVQVQPKTNN